MNLETDDWVISTEAGRLLGVSHQRVAQLANDGVVDHLRPWPFVLLISRRAIAERLAGQVPGRIVSAEARRWVLARHDTSHIEEVDVNVLREQLLEFILERRPTWAKKRQDVWALNMASKLRNQSYVRRRQARAT